MFRRKNLLINCDFRNRLVTVPGCSVRLNQDTLHIRQPGVLMVTTSGSTWLLNILLNVKLYIYILTKYLMITGFYYGAP